MSGRDRIHWDGRYAERDRLSPADVALPPVFRPFAASFPAAGPAMDLACGRGTTAVWLARRGLTVTGYDISTVALAHAVDLAEQCGVADRCAFVAIDLDTGMPPGPPVTTLICNKFRDPALDRAIIGRLAPGGVLAISALSEVGATPGRFRAGPGELIRAFAELEVIAADEAHGEAWLLARRPH